MLNIIGSFGIVYLAGTGVVTGGALVARGLGRSVRRALQGEVREAAVEALAGLAAPALASGAAVAALVMDALGGAQELAGDALQEAGPAWERSAA